MCKRVSVLYYLSLSTTLDEERSPRQKTQEGGSGVPRHYDRCDGTSDSGGSKFIDLGTRLERKDEPGHKGKSFSYTIIWYMGHTVSKTFGDHCRSSHFTGRKDCRQETFGRQGQGWGREKATGKIDHQNHNSKQCPVVSV